MKTQRIFIALFLTIMLVLNNVSPALAMPPLPSSFLGTVKVDGANVSLDTIVSAQINGVQYAYVTVSTYGSDTVYSFDVPGDDPSTSNVEGGVEGDTIVFYIGSIVADQTGTWHTGTNITLNLTATTPVTCYALTLSHSGQGSTPVASPANSTGCSAGQYVSGASISLSGATPSTGWQISGWSGTANDSSTTSTNSLSMPASAKTVSVIYSQITHVLTVAVSPAGSGTTNPAAGTYTYVEGTLVNVAATPASGYAFDHWSDACSGNGVCSVTISTDKTVTAVFVAADGNQPPVANAGGPYTGNEGSWIGLSAAKSMDSDNNITIYQWDLDNDGQFDDATGKMARFSTVDNGTYTVRVKVTDAGGLSSVASATVTVKNVAPTLKWMWIPWWGRVGRQFIVQAAFSDPGVKDTFTATWKWGDGTASVGKVAGSLVTGSHTYAKPGFYVVTITVTDKDGGVGQTSRWVFVYPRW